MKENIKTEAKGRVKRRVLFVCVQNSARSQMAAALLNAICPEDFEAESAGLEPGKLNPLAVQVMAEKGIDISISPTRAVFDLYKAGRLFSYVVTVCDQRAAERCPIFPGVVRREHWSFEDPGAFTGTEAERLSQTRAIRDQIEARLREWCRETTRV